MFEGLVNPANRPELLQIRPQTKFHTEKFGNNLDGEVTAKEILIFCGPALEMEIRGAQPDPSAPQSLIFSHDTNQPLAPSAGINTVGPQVEGDVMPVPFFSQRDNPVNPDGTCNTSSNAMLCAYLSGQITTDDEFTAVRERYSSDSTLHPPQAQALREFGIESYWDYGMTFEALDDQLARGIPTVIGILHRGSESYPTGGHICVVIGKTTGGDYVVNDPYGSVNNDYADGNGAGVVYSKKVLESRWTANGPGSGWGRIVESY